MIPKLKKIDATLETRDIWAALIEKNRAQNKRVLNDAVYMQTLLQSQLKNVKYGEEISETEPREKLFKLNNIWNYKIELELYDIMTNLQIQNSGELAK